MTAITVQKQELKEKVHRIVMAAYDSVPDDSERRNLMDALLRRYLAGATLKGLKQWHSNLLAIDKTE